jgi:hypothetical protein
MPQLSPIGSNKKLRDPNYVETRNQQIPLNYSTNHHNHQYNQESTKPNSFVQSKWVQTQIERQKQLTPSKTSVDLNRNTSGNNWSNHQQLNQ